MTRYSVNKFFGHFWQCWDISAESEEDAWNRAEKDGRLKYQNLYREQRDLESKGYVVNLDEKAIRKPPISIGQYNDWMREAIEKGMVVSPDEYERAFGGGRREENID